MLENLSIKFLLLYVPMYTMDNQTSYREKGSDYEHYKRHLSTARSHWLIKQHLSEMAATSPPESTHALGIEKLKTTRCNVLECVD